MGPRLFSRGNARLMPHAAAAAFGASMGPRLFSRGNERARRRCTRPASWLQWGRGSFSRGNTLASAKLIVDLSAASMGPRLFSRGNCGRPRRMDAVGTGFNGAAAVQPRKCAAQAAGDTARQSFNGAAALQPRKWRHSGAAALISARASMGPRLFSRGNHRRRRLASLMSRASMGPRLFSRGNVASWSITGGVPADASMGPRLIQPRKSGDGGWIAYDPCFNGAAALQPRKCRASRPSDRRGSSLQWGRGCSAAEIRPIGRGASGESAASMGPRLFSRGNRRSWRRRRRRHGFNGAAALQPRKSAIVVACHWSARRFNGAAALQPRKCLEAVRCRSGVERFNGAAAHSAAEMRRRRADHRRQRAASMGPRLIQPRKSHASQTVAALTVRYTVSSGCCPEAISGILQRGVVP